MGTLHTLLYCGYCESEVAVLYAITFVINNNSRHIFILHIFVSSFQCLQVPQLRVYCAFDHGRVDVTQTFYEIGQTENTSHNNTIDNNIWTTFISPFNWPKPTMIHFRWAHDYCDYVGTWPLAQSSPNKSTVYIADFDRSAAVHWKWYEFQFNAVAKSIEQIK